MGACSAGCAFTSSWLFPPTAYTAVWRMLGAMHPGAQASVASETGSATPSHRRSRRSRASSFCCSSPSPGRHCHSTLSVSVIGCHSLGIYTVVLLSSLPFSVRMTASPRAFLADPAHREGVWRGAIARRVSGWPRLAHAFLWEYSYRRLKLAQLLGQLGVFFTCG